MSDKRDIQRLKKRISIRYGTSEASRVGFSEDISRTGMFIKTPNIVPPNTKIKIAFEAGDNSMIEIEARVMWAKKVPHNMFHLVKKCGMGVKFLNFSCGEERFNHFFEALAVNQLPINKNRAEGPEILLEAA